jgi:hypothetical protein
MPTRGRVGGAHYNPTTETLYLMEDTTDGAHFDLIKTRELLALTLVASRLSALSFRANKTRYVSR